MSGARARTAALLLGAALLSVVMLALLPAPRASAAPSASDVRTAAERWCAQALARAWARPGVDAFVAGRVDSSRGFWFVHVGQRWRGLAVEPVDVCVTLDARGTVLRSNGTLVPRPEPAGAWTLGATEAEARGRQAAAVRSAPVGAAERVLALSGGALRPAYRVRSAPMPGLEPNELIVDAERGDVLIARGGAWHAVGNVYPSDGRDTLATVTLTGLDAGDSVLSGPLVRAEDGTLRQLVGPNGDFRLTPSVPDTTQFDEVNVWWYVQQYLSWLGSRGYRGFPDTLHVRTHAAIAPNVAYTSGNYVLLADSVTNFAHDAARARDVVTHELQHFVSEGYGLVHGSREGDALQEGLSDYMAAACTGDARIGEWEYRLYPNGVTTVASDPAVFNYANLGQVSWGGVEAGSTWADGMIFSGALWDLRTQLGATADSLVLEALSRVPASPMFGEFARGLLAADEDLHAGVDTSTVRAVMDTRGIVWRFVTIGILGPDSLDVGQAGTFMATFTPAAPTLVPSWSVMHDLDGGPVDSVGAGQGLTFTHADDRAFRVRVMAPPAWSGSAGGSSWSVWLRGMPHGLSGPTQLRVMQPGTFTLVADTSLDTTSIRWQIVRHCTGACVKTVTLTGGRSVRYGDSLSFEVVVQAKSRWGEVVFDSREVNVAAVSVTVIGPTSADIGAPMAFSVSPSNGFTDIPPTWYVQQWCCRPPCGPVIGTGTGWSFTYGDSSDFQVVMEARNAWGYVERDTVHVTVGGPYSVRVRGPGYFSSARDTLRYSAVVHGDAPFTYEWYTMRLDGSGRLLRSRATAFTTTSISPFLLEADVADCMGRKGASFMAVRMPSLTLSGPTVVNADSAATFTGTLDTVYTDLSPTWSLRRRCAGCDTTWRALAGGLKLTHATRTDYDLRLVVADTVRFQLGAQLSVQVTPPRAHVVAAGAVAGAGLTYKADAGGAGPFTYLWHRLPATGTGSAQLLGRGPTALVATPPPYRVRLLVTDVNNRSAADTLLVAADTTADSSAAAPAAGDRLGLTCSSATSAGLVVLLWGPATELARLTVFDVSGREVAEWYAGPFAGGSRLLMRQTGALAQGAYFLRWQAGGSHAVRRFVVLR